MATLDSNKVTGVSVVSNSTDAANKLYVDDRSLNASGTPSTFLSVPPESGVYWFLRTSGSSGNSINSLIYANNTFLAAGNSKTLVSSTDGINWTARTTGAPENLNSIIYANNQYLLGGSTPVSPFWTLRTSGFGTTNINDITFANGYFVAGGFSNSVTWTLRTSGFGTTNINDITFANGYFVAGGLYDPLNLWTQRTSGFGASTITSLTFGNNLYVAGGVGNLSTSTDTITWELRTSGFGDNEISANCLIYVNNTYVAGGQNGVLNTSTDAITWTYRTSGFGTSQIRTIIYANNLYLAGGTNGVLTTSTDAITWTLRTSGFSNVSSGFGNSIRCSVYANNLYVIAGNDAQLATSTDTITWVFRTSGFGILSILDIIYANNTYFAAGDSGTLTTSTDTITWTYRTSGFGASNIQSLLYANNTYVAGGSGGTLTTSTDAITWTQRNSGFGSSLIRVVEYYNNTFFAGGFNGTLTTASSIVDTGALTTVSTDAVTWTTRTTANGISQVDKLTANSSYYLSSNSNYSGTSFGIISASTDNISWVLRTAGVDGRTINALYADNSNYLIGGVVPVVSWTPRIVPFDTTSVLSSLLTSTYGNGIYIAAGFGGRVVSSTDTITWTLRTVGYGTTAIYGSTFGNGSYLVAGETGIIVTSTDAITWETRTSGFGNTAIWELSYGNNLYLATGNGARLSTSTDAITWELRTSGATASIQAIAYAAGQTEPYLYGDNAGRLSTSTDAISWTIRTVGLLFNIQAIAYASGQTNAYVAGGVNGNYVTSTDAITWTVRTAGVGTAQIGSIIYANNLYTLVSFSGTRVSTDAIVWTARTSVVNRLYTITYDYDNNLYFAAGGSSFGGIVTATYDSLTNIGNGGVLSTSTDTINWRIRTTLPNVQQVDAITSGPSFYLAAFTDYYFNTTLAVSTDTINWIARTSASSSQILALATNNSVYVATGVRGVVQTSTDTITWTLRTASVSTNLFERSQELNLSPWSSNFLTITANADTAPDLTVTAERATNTPNQLSFIGRFLTLDYNTTYTVSIFAKNVSGNGQVAFEIDNLARSVGYDFVTFDIVNQTIAGNISSNSQIISVGNGWYRLITTFTTPSPGVYDAAPVFNTIYIGSYGPVSTTNTVALWGAQLEIGSSVGSYVPTASTTVTNPRLSSLTFSNGLFLSVSSNSGMMSMTRFSTDGIVWLARTSNLSTTTGTQVANSASGNNTFVSSGVSGLLQSTTLEVLADSALVTVSTDGISWTSRTSKGIIGVNKLASNSSYYLSSGTNYFSSSGLISASTDNISWVLRTAGVSGNTINSLYADNSNYLIGGVNPNSVVSWTLRSSTLTPTTSFIYANNLYIASATLSSGISVSTDTIIWIARTTGSNSAVLSTQAFIYAQDQINSYVHISNSDIITSTDTIVWELRTSGISANLYSGAYGNSTYVAVGQKSAPGAIITSTDAIVWTSRTTGASGATVSSIVFGNNIFVALENGGTARSSTDGIVWIGTNSGFGSSLSRELIYANGLYIAGGEAGILNTSIDGSAWTQRTSGFGIERISSIVYGNNLYVAAGGNYGGLRVSTDTIIWTARTLGLISSSFAPLLYANNLFLIGNDSSNLIATATYDSLTNIGNGGLLSVSTDTINWRIRTTVPNVQQVDAITSGPSFYLAAFTDYYSRTYGSGTTLSASTDTISWVLRTSGFGSTLINDLTYGNNLYIAAGDNGIISTSTDTITWTLRTSAISTSITTIDFANNLYNASGDSGVNLISTDGVMWIARTSGTTNTINNIAYGNNVYASAGQSGYLATGTYSSLTNLGDGAAILSSTDAITWTIRTTPVSTQTVVVEGLVSGQNYYLSYGINNISTTFVMASTDSITWSLRTTGLTSVRAGAYGNNLYLIGSGNGSLGTSTDTITWTLRTSGFGLESINSISYGDNLYVAVGNNGSITTSTDAISWTPRISPTNLTYQSVSYVNNLYTIVGGTPIVRSGLLLYLDAGDKNSYPGSGTTWYDLSGRGNNGTLVNGVGYNSGNGGSLSFDGVDDRVSLPTDLDTILTGDLTMEVIIAVPNPVFSQEGFYFSGIMGICGDGNYYRESTIQIGNTGNVSNPSTFGASVAFLDQVGNTNNSIGFGVFSFSSTPRVLSYTLSGTTATTYVNGSFIETKTITKYTKPADANIEIGWVNNQANYGYYRGNLFVSRIYNRALTSAEVSQNFNALRGRYGI